MLELSSDEHSVSGAMCSPVGHGTWQHSIWFSIDDYADVSGAMCSPVFTVMEP